MLIFLFVQNIVDMIVDYDSPLLHVNLTVTFENVSCVEYIYTKR